MIDKKKIQSEVKAYIKSEKAKGRKKDEKPVFNPYVVCKKKKSK